MKYLTLSADYGSISIQDANSDQIDPLTAGFSDALIGELLEWNAQYQAVIPLDPSERSEEKIVSLISRLDNEGIELARRIKDELGPDAKVSYFSEGELKRLPLEMT